MSTVILRWAEYDQLLTVARLRVEVQTYLGTALLEDVDLHGFAAAHQFIVTNPRCRRT